MDSLERLNRPSSSPNAVGRPIVWITDMQLRICACLSVDLQERPQRKTETADVRQATEFRPHRRQLSMRGGHTSPIFSNRRRIACRGSSLGSIRGTSPSQYICDFHTSGFVLDSRSIYCNGANSNRCSLGKIRSFRAAFRPTTFQAISPSS